MRSISLVFLVLFSIGLLSCATPPPTASEDEAAKTFSTPTNNLARIYIYRPMKAANALSPSAIDVDGETIGHLESGQFFLITLSPGDHLVGSYSVRIPLTNAKSGLINVTVPAKAGNNYYVRVIKPWGRTSQFEVVSGSEAQAEIRDTKLQASASRP